MQLPTPSRRFFTALTLAALPILSTCASSKAAVSDPADATVALQGGERITWTQPGLDISNYSFTLLLDGRASVPLPDAMCRNTAAQAFECEASLPPLPPGRHDIQLGAAVTASGRAVEGRRASAFSVIVASDAQ